MKCLSDYDKLISQWWCVLSIKTEEFCVYNIGWGQLWFEHDVVNCFNALSCCRYHCHKIPKVNSSLAQLFCQINLVNNKNTVTSSILCWDHTPLFTWKGVYASKCTGVTEKYDSNGVYAQELLNNITWLEETSSSKHPTQIMV